MLVVSVLVWNGCAGKKMPAEIECLQSIIGMLQIGEGKATIVKYFYAV